jgi:proline dehydrogenase
MSQMPRMPHSADPFDTAPPEAERISALRRLKLQAVDGLSAAIMPVVKAAARPYVGGETIEDALCVAERLAGEGMTATLGYWDVCRDGGRRVADIDVNAIRAIAACGLDGYISVKPPALRFDATLAGELADAAADTGRRLHCDSHGPEVADRANAMLQAMIGRRGGLRLGTTLPGRWRRSLDDADWAIARNLNVRVVKGQWPDLSDPKRDLAGGFLEVIDRLAGRACHVAVATHETALAVEAVGRLKAAGTPCEIELLFGMPALPLVRWAAANGVAVRIYVPFGDGFVPNAIRVLKRNPRLFFVIAKDRLHKTFGG